MTAQAPRPTRRQFLAAVPLAAAPLAATSSTIASVGNRCELLQSARAYSQLIPTWTEAAEELASSPSNRDVRLRFETIDTQYDNAKRRLIELMRRVDRHIVIDREAGRVYLDCNPAGLHEDIDADWVGRSVVRVIPLEKIDGLV